MRAPRLAVNVSLVVSFVLLSAIVAPVAARQQTVTSASAGRHIVVLRDSVANPAAAAADLGRRNGFDIDRVYSHAIKGFAARIPAGRLAALRNDPRVAYAEADQIARISQTTPTGIQRIFASSNTAIDIDGLDDYRVDVDVAIIDTGIDLDHPDLNVVASTNCSGSNPFRASCGSGGDDDNAHGTHVAGTVGALDNGQGVVGVAPGARLHAVKVLRADGSGYISSIVAGIDWVTARAGTIEVANMSLGCQCTSTAMDQAIAKSVDAGVAYAVAAGNNDADASTFSPANHPDVLTVSALADFDGAPGGVGGPTCRGDQDDTLADFSNFGSRIEIAAPGVCILSSVPGGGYDWFSGTSMASPHAAGALGLVASGGADPKNQTQVNALYAKLITNGNLNWTDDSGDGIKERLLDVSDGTVFSPTLVAVSGGANAAPTANNDSATTNEGLAKTIDVLANDTDPDARDTLSVASVTQPTNGKVVINANQTVEYTPDAGYSGGDSFTYIATDGTANSNSATVSITVAPASSGGIDLAVRAYKLKGVQKADLTWSGATSASVDIFRNGTRIATTTNDGAYTDNIDQKGGGSYTYRVCEAGNAAACSADVTVTF